MRVVAADVKVLQTPAPSSITAKGVYVFDRRSGFSLFARDADLMLEMGVGTKFFVTKRIAPRLDLRLDATQREGGGLTGGAALHGEVLLGVSVVL